MRQILYQNRVFLAIGWLLLIAALLSSAKQTVTRETVIMSRPCANGWYVIEQDEERLTLACTESTNDDTDSPEP